jgi:hypothetical protein
MNEAKNQACPSCERNLTEGEQVYICKVCGHGCCTVCSENLNAFDVICDVCEEIHQEDRAGDRKPAASKTPEPSTLASATGSASGWAWETMMMINKMTPDIKGKAFDPDWFVLRERLEQAGHVIDAGKMPITRR